MSGTLSATTASALAPLLQTITGVAGAGSTAYNLYNQYQNQQYQNTLRSDAQNPAKVTALAQQYTQPLTAGLTAAVNNQTQAQLASAGLSESPQIAQTVEAQAIAPYIQNNQNQGYSLALQALGLGGGAIPPGQQQQNSLSSLAKAFSQLSGPQQAGSPTTPGLLDYLRTFGTQSGSAFPASPGSGSEPAPTDWSGLDPAATSTDMSSFYTPDYSVSGAGSAAGSD